MMVSYMYRDNDMHEYRGDMYHHAGKMTPGAVRIKYRWCLENVARYRANLWRRRNNVLPCCHY